MFEIVSPGVVQAEHLPCPAKQLYIVLRLVADVETGHKAYAKFHKTGLKRVRDLVLADPNMHR